MDTQLQPVAPRTFGTPVAERCVRVAVIEGRREAHESLRSLFASSRGYACAGAFASVEDVMRVPGGPRADVLLADLVAAGPGLEGLQRLSERFPDLPLVVHAEHRDVDRVHDVFRAGACGFLVKGSRPERLLQGIRDVYESGSTVSPEVAGRMISALRTGRPRPRPLDQALTPHETRVLKLLVEGHNYKTAAQQLRVSVNTVSFHVKRIYEKLDVHSKSEAVSRALRYGLVD